MSIKALVGLCCISIASLALAAGDLGIKPPDKPQGQAVDKTPTGRCTNDNVNACRAACETKKFEVASKPELAKKQQECKQDCIRGC